MIYFPSLSVVIPITSLPATLIRLPMEQVKTAGRATQGVRLIKVNAENKVSSVEVVEKAAETEEDKSEEE